MRCQICLVISIVLTLACSEKLMAQGYGIELHNNAMPASGAMGGTSFSQPQDVQSAINGNPATMGQFVGPTFGFGGALIEPTYNVSQARNVPLVGVTPYSGKSDAPLSLLANLGVINQTSVMGVPLSMGLGFISNAGLASDFRHIDESNGTHSSYVALDLVSSAAIELSEGWSVGGSFALGTSFLDGPFVQSSSQQTAYGTRFKIGTNYLFENGFSVGAFWESKKSLEFDNVIRFASGPAAGVTQDLKLEHPANFGLGIAKGNLMNGRLLLAADVLYKNWDDTDFFGAIFQDQWAISIGGQFEVNSRLKLRLGYAFNEDATRDQVPGDLGGVIGIGDVPVVQYIQGQFAAISQHRLTGGFGVSEIMPNTNFDITAGGVFENEKAFGDTTAKLDGYFIAFGFTYTRPTCCNR